MGEDLYLHIPQARQVFDQVEQATGTNVATLCFNADEETLRQTENTQIALYAAGLAAFYALHASLPGLKPVAMAGHSVGEYAALAAAGWLSIEDGARLVAQRGAIMGRAGKERPGTMAAVLGLDQESLSEVLAEITGGTVVVANDNCPGQLVMSGDFGAVQRASAMASERGAKRVLPLNVSGAFHSPLMQQSAEELAGHLGSIRFEPTGLPVYSNVTAAPGTDWARLLEEQLRSSVRWRESVANMVAAGVTTFVECGSGEVLTGLLRRISPESTGFRVNDMATLEATVAALEGKA